MLGLCRKVRGCVHAPLLRVNNRAQNGLRPANDGFSRNPPQLVSALSKARTTLEIMVARGHIPAAQGLERQLVFFGNNQAPAHGRKHLGRLKRVLAASKRVLAGSENASVLFISVQALIPRWRGSLFPKRAFGRLGLQFFFFSAPLKASITSSFRSPRKSS